MTTIADLVRELQARGVVFKLDAAGDVKITTNGALTREDAPALRRLRERLDEVKTIVAESGKPRTRIKEAPTPSGTPPAPQHDEPAPRIQCGLTWRGEPVYVTEADVREALRRMGDDALEAYDTGGMFEFMPMTKRRAYAMTARGLRELDTTMPRDRRRW